METKPSLAMDNLSIPLKILTLLADGQSRSVVEMGQALGLSPSQIWRGFKYLRDFNCFVSLPISYELTEGGRAYLALRQARAIATQERAALIAEARAARKVRTPKAPKPPKVFRMPSDLVHLVVPASRERDSIVSSAIECRPQLQSVWGASHV